MALEVAKRICSECGYSPTISSFAKNLGEYVAIHIRRTDKVRDKAVCALMISRSELDDLNEKTKAVIKSLRVEGHSRFLICSDDDKSMVQYQNFVVDCGGEVLEIPKMEKSVSTYYDMASMSFAKVVVQSQRNSAFSNYASCIGDVPLWNVYQKQPSKFI